MTRAPPSTSSDRIPNLCSWASPSGRSIPSGASRTTAMVTPRSCRSARRAGLERSVVRTMVRASAPKHAVGGRRRGGIKDHPDRRRTGDHPHRQQGVVGQDGAGTDRDRVAGRPEGVGNAALSGAADPLGVPAGGGDPAVQRLGVLQDDVGTVRARADIAQQGRGVKGLTLTVETVDSIQRVPARSPVAELLRLGLHIAAVAEVRRGLDGHELVDHEAFTGQGGPCWGCC